MARAVIVLTDNDNDTIDFEMNVDPEPRPDVPATPVQVVAFDIFERLRQMQAGLIDDEEEMIDPTDWDDDPDDEGNDDDTDRWETT